MKDQGARRILPIACATVVALALTAAPATPALAAKIVLPDVPANLRVAAPNHVYFVGHAIGTQNYVCAPSAAAASGVAFKLFTPEATLFNDEGKELTTHYFSPNPDEVNTDPKVTAGGVIRATWQDSRDSSRA